MIGASFLSSPGRVLRLALGTGDADRPVRALLHELDNAAYHLRAIAPQTFLRDEVAEVSIFGASNLSNVAPVPFGPSGDGHRLLIGCDPATPTEISPTTLNVHGPVGFRHEWTPFLEGTLQPMTMTSGHPHYDPNDGHEGCLYIPELLPRPPIRPTSRIGAYPQLRTWSGAGELKGPFYLTINGELVFLPEASIHQVGSTRDYVLMAMTPISFGIATLIFPFIDRLLVYLPEGTRQAVHDWMLDRLADSAQLPETRLYIIRKEDIREAERTEAWTVPCVESRWDWETSHFFCDYENPGDKLTLFAALSIGFDATRSIQLGEELLDSRTVPPEVNTIFAAATDLQVCARYEIDARVGGKPLSERLTPSRDPDDPRFPLGVMLQIPTVPLSYKPIGAGDYDLGEISREWSHTFWCSTGWMPVMETRRIFDLYRESRVTDRLNAGKPPQRYIDEDVFLDRSRKPTNNAVIYRLDREMNLDLDQDVWRWEPGWLSSAPFFAPRADATSVDEGFLICLVSPPTPNASMEIWVFDTALPLADGPVCVLEPDRSRPFRIGYPLHSVWMEEAAVEGWQPPAYRVPMTEPPLAMQALDLMYIGSSYLVSAARSRLVELANWIF